GPQRGRYGRGRWRDPGDTAGPHRCPRWPGGRGGRGGGEGRGHEVCRRGARGADLVADDFFPSFPWWARRRGAGTRSRRFGAAAVSSLRTLMVPDGLAGERVDVGASRMLGLSRSRAAELIDAGLVEVGGTAPARSTRLEPGAMLSVELPEEKPVAEVRPMIAEGMSLVHQDDDLVVI